MTDTLRIPPNSVQAEQAVLGGLMIRPEALVEISDWLTDRDFYRRDHQLIYRSIVELIEAGKPCDAITLGEWFDDQGISELVGGTRYIIEVANSCASAANITAYAEIVREKSRLRQLIDVGTTLTGAAFESKSQAVDLVATTTQELGALGIDARVGGLKSVRADLKPWLRELTRRYDSRERITGVRTPWIDLTEATKGWQPGDLIIVAGRPSMGKSVFGFQCAAEAAFAGQRTALFSVEMGRDQALNRIAACFGNIRHEAIRCPVDMDDHEWPRLTGVMEQLHGAPLLIDDQGGLSSTQIVARARREHLREPLSLIVVDHLHHLKRKGKDLVQELGEMVLDFKTLAKSLVVPVILLAQLNRGSANRADHRPTMADLRASGEIEQIADVVLLLHREDYYDKDTHMKGIVEVILGKGRDLPAGKTLYLANQFEFMRLENFAGEIPNAPQREARSSFQSRFGRKPVAA